MKNFIKSLLIVVVFFSNIDTFYAQEKVNQLDSNKKRHGVWKKYYNNGRVRYVGKFNHGKEVGTFKYYSAASSDFPIVIKEFNEANNQAQVEFYTDKGVLESQGLMIDKYRVGKWLYFHVDGKKIMSEENYNDKGELHGEYKTFFNTGKPTEVTSYINGKLDGNYKKYSIKGHLYQDLNYKNGLLNGPAAYYSRKSGELITKGQFINNVRVGTWENYADGELVSTEQPNKKKPKRKITKVKNEN